MVTKINKKIFIRHDINKLYDLLKDMPSFPEYIPALKELKTIRTLHPQKIITQWKIYTEDTDIIWQEEDTFNDKKKSVSFRMLKGDYALYKGKWKLQKADKGTSIYFSALFDWGMPNLGKHVGPILDKKANFFVMSMLRAIKKKAEKI